VARFFEENDEEGINNSETVTVVVSNKNTCQKRLLFDFQLLYIINAFFLKALILSVPCLSKEKKMNKGM
jgi:hypothetical protein